MMRRFTLLATLISIVMFGVPAQAGVSIRIGEPGYYGSLDIGGFPQPELIYPQPMVIERPAVGVVAEPMYLHVPPGHAKHWGKHCRKYNACGRPVYFVQDRWYQEHYVPRYREMHHGHDN